MVRVIGPRPIGRLHEIPRDDLPLSVADRPEVRLLLVLAEVIRREGLAANGHFQRVGLEGQADVLIGGTNGWTDAGRQQRNRQRHDKRGQRTHAGSPRSDSRREGEAPAELLDPVSLKRKARQEPRPPGRRLQNWRTPAARPRPIRCQLIVHSLCGRRACSRVKTSLISPKSIVQGRKSKEGRTAASFLFNLGIWTCWTN